MKRYVVMYECDKFEEYDYIRDAAEAWASYPSDLECCVLDRINNTEIDAKTLESAIGYKKLAPCALKKRSAIAYMY